MQRCFALEKAVCGVLLNKALDGGICLAYLPAPQHASIAQLVEQLIRNQQVWSSNLHAGSSEGKPSSSLTMRAFSVGLFYEPAACLRGAGVPVHSFMGSLCAQLSVAGVDGGGFNFLYGQQKAVAQSQ